VRLLLQLSLISSPRLRDAWRDSATVGQILRRRESGSSLLRRIQMVDAFRSERQRELKPRLKSRTRPKPRLLNYLAVNSGFGFLFLLRLKIQHRNLVVMISCGSLR
jgi:hypothetical protein